MKKCQKVKGNNLKVGSDEFINTLCSEPFRQLANYVSVQRSGIYMLRFDQRQSAAAVNVWNTFAELEQPFSLLCSGIEIKHPQMRFENGRVAMRIKQRKDAINIDMYCDNDH